MDQNKIITICKDLGCCDACCLRYIGLKNPSAFEDPYEHVLKILNSEPEKNALPRDCETISGSTHHREKEDIVPAKRTKRDDVCTSCIGVLQEEAWEEGLVAVRRMLDEKRYECEEFACALSAPVATVLRERAVAARISDHLALYDHGTVTPLKEAWKWMRGESLARCCRMALRSGEAAPLLVTLHLTYEHETRELAALGAAARTRRGALEACERAPRDTLRACASSPPSRARVASAAGERRPLALGGRYVKLSRELPQTPWVLEGRRVLPSSVQDVIFTALAAILGIRPEEAERRLKFMSAGREDVDVRCLGDGRPFAVEVADPRREPTAEELRRACESISAGGVVRVETLVPVTREKLGELKKGEESKCKTYEALCIKLSHTSEEVADGAGSDTPVEVRPRDVEAAARWSADVVQRTPLRVLHRRPLLARARNVHVVAAAAVPHHPRLLVLRLRTHAGTYVKEWAHGELRRTAPSLRDVLSARTDILALDVTAVHLSWP